MEERMNPFWAEAQEPEEESLDQLEVESLQAENVKEASREK